MASVNVSSDILPHMCTFKHRDIANYGSSEQDLALLHSAFLNSYINYQESQSDVFLFLLAGGNICSILL